MNKLWVAAPVILIAAAIPYFTGAQAENAFSASSDELNQYFTRNAVPLQIIQDRYEKGFLTSQAISRIRVMETGGDDADPSRCVELFTELSHGYLDLLSGQWGGSRTILRPLPEQSHCVLGELYANEKRFTDFYQRSFDADGPVILNANYKFNGSANIEYTVNAFDIDESDSTDTLKVAVDKLQGEFNINGARNNISFNLRWPGFKAKGMSADEAFEISLDGLSLTGHQELALANLWIGSAEQNIGSTRVQVTGKDNISFSFSDIALTGDTGIDDNKLQSASQIKLTGLSSGGSDLGNLSLAINIAQIDVNALDNVLDTFRDFMAKLQIDDNTKQMASLDNDKFLQNLKTIADSGLIEIESLDYNIGDHKAHVDGVLRLADLESVPAKDLFKNPVQLFNHLRVKFNAALDEALVRDIVEIFTDLNKEFAGMDANTKSQVKDQLMTQFTQAAGNFTQMNYLRYDADKLRYKTQIQFADGKATINDQPFAVPSVGH